jgi:hypothetical protein
MLPTVGATASSTHPACSRIGVRDKPSPGRGLGARPSQLEKAVFFEMKAPRSVFKTAPSRTAWRLPRSAAA